MRRGGKSNTLPAMHDAFAADQYLIRQQVFTFLHRKFHVYDAAGQNLVLFCRMKGFKLKEDLRLFADENESQELVRIQARSVIDFSAAYDVVDARSERRLGVLRRKGWSSIVRDSWEILDADERPLGTIQEDSTIKALVRRFVDAASFLMPQAFHVEIGGAPAATFKQNFNPFVRKLAVDFSADSQRRLDRLFGLAAGILVMAIEGKQE
jgi:uncharacterized protein YxjI